jgi:hypothetical protein
VVKLDLGCGKNKQNGFIGVDSVPFEGVDVVHDLTTPWPWGDDSVDEVYCSHTLEHLTQEQRCFFARELMRVLKAGAKATIITPSWTSERAYGDPTHKWPGVCAMSYMYWNKAWRDINAPHTEEMLKGVDFDFGGGYNFDAEWINRNDEMRMFAAKNYLNAVSDLFVTVTKRG